MKINVNYKDSHNRETKITFDGNYFPIESLIYYFTKDCENNEIPFFKLEIKFDVDMRE